MSQLPMIIFTTCSLCGHCISFRGPDGKPSDKYPWNPGFIRKCLLDGSGMKLKCLRLINIHDGEFGADVSYIKEFNIYHMIPSDLKVTEDFFETIMSDKNPYVGNSILRVAVIKNSDMTINFSVEIDGSSEDQRCEHIEKLVENFFFWNHIPLDFELLREHIYNVYNNKKTDFLENIITPELRADNFHSILIKEYRLYCQNPNKFDNLMKIRFDYSWFINSFYPYRLRELERMYPSWMLILPSEWKKGLHSNDPVYAKIASLKTVLKGNKFESSRAGREQIEDLIIQYHAGRLSLTYEGVLMKQNQPENKKSKSVRFEI